MLCGTLRTRLRNLWNWTRCSTDLGKLPPTCFKLIESFKDKSLPHPMFSVTSKLGSWIDIANAFNDLFASNFNTNSYETRIPDDSQSLIFFNDFCDTFSDSDILQVILSCTACTYENMMTSRMDY